MTVTGWWCRITVEKDSHQHWLIKAMHVTFLQTTDKETSGDLSVGDIPPIPLGVSFVSDRRVYSFHGTVEMTNNETAKSKITVRFYGLQVHIHIPIPITKKEL